MSSRLVDGNEVRLVVPKVHGGICIFNREAKSPGQFCKCRYVLRIVQELRKLTLEIVITGYKIENTFLTFPNWPGPRERLARGKQTRGFEELRRLLFDGQSLKRLLENVYAYVVSDRRTHRL